MTFIDDLALVEVLLAFVAALFAYSGVLIWWAIRKDDPAGVRRVLKGAAVPLGALGGATLFLALWGEMAWPFPAGIAGYNIFWYGGFEVRSESSGSLRFTRGEGCAGTSGGFVLERKQAPRAPRVYADST